MTTIESLKKLNLILEGSMFGGRVSARILLAAFIILLPTFLAIRFLVKTPPQYAAVMTISPNLKDPRTNQAASSLGVGSLAASLLGANGDTGLPQLYVELLNKLYSPEVGVELFKHPDVMEKLYPGQYDAKSGTIHGNPGMLYPFKRLITGGRFVYAPPGPGEVGTKLRELVSISQVGSTSMRKIRLYDTDPVFARKLLFLVFTAADNAIKQSEATRARELHEYLTRQLARPNALNSEQMLRSLAEQYESQLILSSLAQPMSAQIVDMPHAGTMPDIPRFSFTMMVGFSISSFLAILYFYYLLFWQKHLRKWSE
jgi:uncharacterized protein involved in exopolysaccharide biosynthesis